MPPKLPRVIGHRGAAALAPENTLAGLRKATALGCTWVEFDTRICADGSAVLMHDETVDRTTDGAGYLADLTLAQVQDLDAGAWFDRSFAGEPPPTLEAALALCTELGLGVVLEIKRDKQGPGRDPSAAVDAVAAAIGQTRHRDSPALLVSSFDIDLLERCRGALPDLPRSLGVGALSDELLHAAQILECVAIAGGARQAKPADPEIVHGAGCAMLIYTVNSARAAAEHYSRGVDSIFSDRPDRIAAICGS